MIPKIDNDIGISVYSTNFQGCQGRIREKKEDFQVFEVLSEKVMGEISNKGDYAVYKLIKNGIDTYHSIENIFKKHGIRLKALGLKDAGGITEQFVCSEKKRFSIDKISEKKYLLERIGFVKKPLSKKNMIGNKFKIKIINPENNISKFDEFDKILNFYGYQRFGSKRAITHLIGKSIIQKNYSRAIEILLSETSEYDSQENIELRNKFSDRSNFSKILKEIPPQMDLERMIIKQMLKDEDPKNAIRTLPLGIRRLFIQAYQSFLFNKTLSHSFENGEEMFVADEGDICFDKYGNIRKFSNEVGEKLAIPIVGYSYYKKTRFHYYISKILESEDLSPNTFFIKDMQEISNEGGFRNSSIQCSDYSFNDNWISFRICRGSFATIVLREIMKPKDPILAGF